jgi:predicted nucleotidyltransferase
MSSVPASYGSLPDAALQALAEVTSREDLAIVGIVLTGSAARGMATEHSDVDVIVVRDESESESVREATRSSAIEEIPLTLKELETIKPVGSTVLGTVGGLRLSTSAPRLLGGPSLRRSAQPGDAQRAGDPGSADRSLATG